MSVSETASEQASEWRVGVDGWVRRKEGWSWPLLMPDFAHGMLLERQRQVSIPTPLVAYPSPAESPKKRRPKLRREVFGNLHLSIFIDDVPKRLPDARWASRCCAVLPCCVPASSAPRRRKQTRHRKLHSGKCDRVIFIQVSRVSCNHRDS